MTSRPSKNSGRLRKKTKLKKRKRSLKVFRLLVLLVFMGLILTALVFVTYNLYSWGSGIAADFRSMYQGYEERREARGSLPNERFDGYTNILLLGVDNGANRDEDYERRADTVMVLSLANDTGRLRVITLPRDTLVNVNGYNGPLGNIYAQGGANQMVRTVSDLLGVSIHQFVVLEMSALSSIIDTLGGIDLYVEEPMDYEDPAADLSIHLPQGFRHLSGDEAQKYLRYRGGDLGDVGRVQRQQKFVKALYQKLLQLDTIPKLPAVADIFRNSVTTSAEIFDSAHLANVLRHLSSEAPQTVMLPGSEGQDDTWSVNEAALAEKIGELFPQEPEL